MLTIFVGVLGAGGCSMAPNYQRPEAPVPQAIGDAANVAEANLPAWNEYFTDRTLNDLVARALELNRDLRIATARMEEARALYGIQRADQLPSFAAGAQETANRTPGPVSITGQSLVTRRYDVNLGLLAFELDFWGRVRSLSDAARASYLASTEAERAFRLSLVTGVANAFFTERALTERAALARRTATTREEGVRVIRLRIDAGVASRLDLLQAESGLESARAAAAALAREAANARHALAVLIGEPVAPADRNRAALDDLQLPPSLPPGLSSAVLLSRPDVLQSEQNLIAANANIGAARAAFFPRISLVGNAGVASDQLNGLFAGSNRAWTFVPSISIPLFYGGRNVANLDLAKARDVIALAQYEKSIQQAFAEVADVLSDQAYLADQLSAQERLFASQTERLKVAQALYDGGLVGYLNVLDAQREQYDAQQTLIDLKRARLAAAAQAYKALGGS